MIIYLDENMPAHLAKGFDILQHPDGIKTQRNIKVIHLPDKFNFGARDIDWIPEIGREGPCVITQDINIHRRKHELELYRKHSVGIFFLRGKSKKQGLSIWEMVQTLAKHWDEITKIAIQEKRPFAYEFKFNSRLKKLK